ncbi:SDR family oxidoreductase [Azospirillum sp. SYSU D00513]|uniref:SDR family NAD(P)-dependent oxidoreductase n=1 Tax=Azospirillum sp. SYSU D00513 TaxID=2812561 RepID=UPI001A97A9CE|nr:SDR family oxidoreductase [Azospirillum sp. SYSU D00513]
MSNEARYPSLRDRVTFITGGGSGIGAELTRSFAAQGARVAFVDIAETESRALCDRVKEETGQAPLFIPCDLRDIPALQAAIEQVRGQLGDVSVLLNNAANDQRHAVEEVTVEYWDERMAINQRPMFFAAQSIAPHMKRFGRGSIVNFGSISWKIGQGGMPAYTMAKASVHGLTRGLARDLGPFGIRVNTLLPGWVMTQRQLDLWVTPESAKQIDASQCIKDRVMPHHIAAMALFLAADDSAACTAQEFTVDGGWS